MKIKFNILAFIILLTGLFVQAQPAVNKKALLIGVGKYPATGGWPSLSSANDLKLIKDALINQGFSAENIIVIADDQATRENIISAIKNKLTKEVKKGDIVYFHFSGHGQQIADKNGDEVDGYDECIVPYDSPKKYEAGINEGQFLITDDELNILFRDLRKQLGSTGHLIVALDACHSGTGTRGAAVGRGTTEPMASPDYIQKNSQKKQLKENNQINNEDVSSSSSALSPMISFFGSAQNQINYEMTNGQGEQFGSLSYALSKYLVLVKKDESYRGLFDKIKVEMATIAPLQQPQAEGDLDIEVLNGKALGAASYYKVISEADDDKILINGGFLQDLNEGTVVGFFNQDVRDIENTKPIATGKVSKSTATSAYIVLDSLVDPGKIKNSWVYILERTMGDIKIGLSIKVSDNALLEKLKSKLFSYKFIVDDPSTPSLIIEERTNVKGEQHVVLHTLDNYNLDSFLLNSNNPGSVAKLSRTIIKYLKGLSIRKLDVQSENLKLSFKIIPVKNIKPNCNIDSLIGLQEDEAGILKMKVGDTFQFLIQNDGEKPAYFNLLDLQPDNMYEIMLPTREQSPEEMKVLANKSKLIEIQFGVNPPMGKEVFKLVASSKPLNLRDSYGTRGNESKNPFEKLLDQFDNTEFYNTRGSKPLPMGNMDINIYSQSFIIVQ